MDPKIRGLLNVLQSNVDNFDAVAKIDKDSMCETHLKALNQKIKGDLLNIVKSLSSFNIYHVDCSHQKKEIDLTSEEDAPYLEIQSTEPLLSTPSCSPSIAHSQTLAADPTSVSAEHSVNSFAYPSGVSDCLRERTPPTVSWKDKSIYQGDDANVEDDGVCGGTELLTSVPRMGGCEFNLG